MPIGSKNMAKILRIFLFVVDRVSNNSTNSLKPKINVSSIASHKTPKIFPGLISFSVVLEISFLKFA